MGNIREDKEGLSIGERNINYIRFADDIVILANDSITLQSIMTTLEEDMEEYGIKIDVGKTKVMRLDDSEHETYGKRRKNIAG